MWLMGRTITQKTETCNPKLRILSLISQQGAGMLAVVALDGGRSCGGMLTRTGWRK